VAPGVWSSPGPAEADTAFRPGGPAPARAVCPSARLRPTLQPDCLRRKRPGVSQPEGATALANLAEESSRARGNTTASHTSPKMTAAADSRRSPWSVQKPSGATALSPTRREAEMQPRTGERVDHIVLGTEVLPRREGLWWIILD
jgi:hypothetical protein